MKVINNSHYLVELAYRVDANGGNNPQGRVVCILQKRTKAYIELPLNIFSKIAFVLQAFLRLSK